MSRLVAGIGALALIITAAGCATAPKTPTEREDLRAAAEETLRAMQVRDPSLTEVLDEAYGYAVFPTVGQGGAVVGGAYGRGVVYEQGEQVGFVELNQASVGAQLGGQTFSELIVFRNEKALRNLQEGSWSVGGQASATALTAGAGRATQFGDNDVAIFVVARGGLMVDLSVAGQRLNYQPLG